MKKSRIVPVLWFALVFAFAVDGVAQSKDLPNLVKINANFYRGGQPTESGVKDLAKLGVKTIINLRGSNEKTEREELWAKNAGLRFINVSLNNWTRPDKSKIDDIVKLVLASENQPVFVHCKRGSDRTGTVVAVYRITQEGWDAKRANAEAKALGFGWWQFWMKDFINDYYRDWKAGKMKGE